MKQPTIMMIRLFNDYENRNIVRIFPIEDYKKMDKLDRIELGVIYIGNDEKSLIDNKEDLFTTIPEKTNCRTFIFDNFRWKNSKGYR